MGDALADYLDRFPHTTWAETGVEAAEHIREVLWAGELAAAREEGRRVGRAEAIALLRDDDALAEWTDEKRKLMETERYRLSWTPLPREFARWAADYLADQAPKEETHD